MPSPREDRSRAIHNGQLMKTWLYRTLWLLLTLAVVYFARAFYSVSDSHIQDCMWKAGDRPVIGDMILFGEGLASLRDGKIHIADRVEATITRRIYRPHADNIIHVEKPGSKEAGIYYEKGCGRSASR